MSKREGSTAPETERKQGKPDAKEWPLKDLPHADAAIVLGAGMRNKIAKRWKSENEEELKKLREFTTLKEKLVKNDVKGNEGTVETRTDKNGNEIIIETTTDKNGIKVIEIIEKEFVAGLELKMRAIAAFELLKYGKVKKIIVTGGDTSKGSGSLMAFLRDLLVSQIGKIIGSLLPKGTTTKDSPVGDEEVSQPIVSTTGVSEAKIVAHYLIEMGVAEQDILMETTSKNTTENIEKITAILEANGIMTVHLVTHEFHLPRTQQQFRNTIQRSGLAVEDLTAASAEALLDARSKLYEGLTDHYTFPKSLRHCPRRAIKTGVREFLRRVLNIVDPGDTIGRALANKVR